MILRNSFTPLSPRDWTIVALFSLESLARASRNPSTYRAVPRILMRVRKYEHITPILKFLHWLPISARIEYKVSLLTHQCIHGNAPTDLKELLTPQISARSLRSTNTHRLHPPRTTTCTIGYRVFCVATPRLWNALPEHLRKIIFLKIYLFKKFFNVYISFRVYIFVLILVDS